MSDIVPAIIIVGLAAVLFWILRTFSDNNTRRKLFETRAGIHRDSQERDEQTHDDEAVRTTTARTTRQTQVTVSRGTYSTSRWRVAASRSSEAAAISIRTAPAAIVARTG